MLSMPLLAGKTVHNLWTVVHCSVSRITSVRAQARYGRKTDSNKKLCPWVRLVPLASGKALARKYLSAIPIPDSDVPIYHVGCCLRLNIT